MVGVPLHLRFAPSPTGHLHLGGLRTALFNYLSARSTGGTLTLRIEDTDTGRNVVGAMEGMLEMLNWTGLKFDRGVLYGKEGEGNVLKVDPSFIQSNRRSIYTQYIHQLLDEGKAYRCNCAPQRLLESRQAFRGYDRRCRSLDLPANIAENHVIRLKAPFGQSYTFQDHDRVIRVDEQVEDAVLMKSDGMPTYHFANVIDDHLMDINLVMRGQEWLPSTPLHIAIYGVLGWTPPGFAHLPLLVRMDGSKLSKRDGDAGVAWYRDSGYLPNALVNFLASIGWTAPSGTPEVMSLDQLSRIVITSMSPFSPFVVHLGGTQSCKCNSEYKKTRVVQQTAHSSIHQGGLQEVAQPFAKGRLL